MMSHSPSSGGIYIVKYWTPPHHPRPNSFNFMQFWGEIWQNRMLVPPLEGWRPTSGKSWIRHCVALNE